MAVHKAPPSLGFSRQEHWSGLPFPSPVTPSIHSIHPGEPSPKVPLEYLLPFLRMLLIFSLVNPREEEPGRLWSIGLQRVRHDWSNFACTHNRRHPVWFAPAHKTRHLQPAFCLVLLGTCRPCVGIDMGLLVIVLATLSKPRDRFQGKSQYLISWSFPLKGKRIGQRLSVLCASSRHITLCFHRTNISSAEISPFKRPLKTQRDRVEREVGGGIRMGNTCISMADSCQCMTKTTTIL